MNDLTATRTHEPWTTYTHLTVREITLLASVLGAGGLAAAVVYPVLWVVTPMVALAIYLGRQKAARVEASMDSNASPFPESLQEDIARAMGQLSMGQALRLLNIVIRQARPLFAERESAFDAAYETETRAHVVELVSGACDVAMELARLDLVSAGHTTGGADELSKRYVSARVELVSRLDAAANALGELYASGVEQGTPASDRVAQLASELQSDARARRSAIGEMKELLDEAGVARDG